MAKHHGHCTLSLVQYKPSFHPVDNLSWHGWERLTVILKLQKSSRRQMISKVDVEFPTYLVELRGHDWLISLASNLADIFQNRQGDDFSLVSLLHVRFVSRDLPFLRLLLLCNAIVIWSSSPYRVLWILMSVCLQISLRIGEGASMEKEGRCSLDFEVTFPSPVHLISVF
jgi:hypothetical protein